VEGRERGLLFLVDGVWKLFLGGSFVEGGIKNIVRLSSGSRGCIITQPRAKSVLKLESSGEVGKKTSRTRQEREGA